MLYLDFTSWVNETSLSVLFEVMEGYHINQSLINRVANLFDDNIQHLSYDKAKKQYKLYLNGLGKKVYSESELKILLSDGTLKGFTMMTLVIIILYLGTAIVIDEIENSFHKNLVENIIMIFNDKRINKNNAQLIFSTHYVEILDILRRRDSVYIMHKNDIFITNCNLYEDYDERIDLSKSNQFNNNTFSTLINYDKLMELKSINT